MRDERKTKAQIINELAELRQQVAELGASEVEHKQAQEALRERVKELACLYAVSRDMHQGLSIDELCQRIIEHLVPAMQFPEITVPLIELDGKRYTSEKHTEGLLHGLHAEIMVADEARGHLWVYYAQDKPFLIPEEQNLVSGVAEALSIWLERKQVEGVLRRRERDYSSLVENAADIIVRFDAGLRHVYCNAAVERQLGIPKSTFLDKTPLEIGTPYEQAELMSRSLRQVLETGEMLEVEQNYPTPLGLKHFQTHIVPEHNVEGQIESLLAITRDITQRVRAEEALRGSEETLRALLNAPTESAMLIDLEGTILAINEVAAQRFGKRADELIGLSLYDYLPPDLAKSRKAQGDEVVRSGQPIRFQDERAGKCFDNNVYPVFDVEGKVTAIAVYARDITETKQVEEALRESECKFREIAKNIPGMVFQFRVRRDGSHYFSYISPNAHDLFGLPRDLDDPDWDWGARVHPDDREQFMASVAQAIANRTKWNFEGRLVTPSGQIQWVQGISSPTQVGDELVFNGVMLDITERKRAEEALRQSEREYRLLFENMTAGFALHEMIYDEQGQPADYRYLEINPAFEKLTGVPASALLGKTVREVLPNTEQYWIEVSGKVAQTGEPIAYQNYSRELGKYYDTCLFSPARDQFAVVFTDITERVQAEQERERLIGELQEALDNIKTLKGLLPICANCKKIRNDEGYWQDVAVYVRDHSEAEFSHGLCPDCVKELYSDFYEDDG